MDVETADCRTPVLFLVYRRADLTARVLERIRQARPARLLVAADGPNPDQANDAQRCQEVRDIVLQGMDWPCALETRFSETNLGCKRAVVTAMNWAFERHERLIIIEDDCLPELSFFKFCDELLERYQDDAQIMQICGTNLAHRGAADGASYYASRFGTIWGWATWRRSWQHNPTAMNQWARLRNAKDWKVSCRFPEESEWRRTIYDRAASGKLDAWSIQWEFAKQIRAGISLIPSVNLVSNIGWGEDATHTLATNDPRSEMATSAIPFPLQHPQSLTFDDEADHAYFSRYCQERPLVRRVINKALKIHERWLR